jgi:hypothetical protein
MLALDTQKGPGIDGISPLILKKIVLVAKKLLAVLFNLSLLSLVFPCVWKVSYVKRRNTRLMDFYLRTNYDQNEPVNETIL